MKYDEIFDSLGPINGKLGGDQVKPVLLNSGLPNDILGKVITIFFMYWNYLCIF